jgi:hypothetical protein
MVILVCGVPRSGTSFCAETLRRCGAYAGEELDPGPPGACPHGLCEDRVFRALHGAAIDKQNYVRQPLEFDLAAQHNERVQSWDATHPVWVVKSWQLIFCAEWLASASQPPALLVHTCRPLDQSVSSVATMFGHREARKHCAAIAEELDRLVGRWKGPKLRIDWSNLHADPSRIVRQLAGFTGLPVTSEALALHNPSYRRHG